MGLDYTVGSVNFRDVGEFINLIAERKIMQEGIFFRGGKTNFCISKEEIGSPKTIINLRKVPDSKDFGASMFHFPISNDHEKYKTSTPEVNLWLNYVFRTFENPELKLPVFIHCLSGKDRTGIVVGIILKLIEIPQEIIIEEYMLSDGEVKKDLFIEAIKGISEINFCFKRIDISQVITNLKNWFKK